MSVLATKIFFCTTLYTREEQIVWKKVIYLLKQ